MQLLKPEQATYQVVGLPEILACRELRQARQQTWLTDRSATLISLTVVAPGPIKDSPLTRQAFNLACLALQRLFISKNWPLLANETFDLPTGAEALIALSIPAATVKKNMVWLEQSYPVGRLWDIDVIDKTGNILSRTDFGSAARRCLVCRQEAKVCGRTRAHTVAELHEAMGKLVENELRSPTIPIA